jgi:hypothetical protein
LPQPGQGLIQALRGLAGLQVLGAIDAPAGASGKRQKYRAEADLPWAWGLRMAKDHPHDAPMRNRKDPAALIFDKMCMTPLEKNFLLSY